MEIFTDVDLFPYNTMRLHSIARIMYFPENESELVELVSSFKKKGTSFILLSAGSNIVFDERVSSPIINLMRLNCSLDLLPNGNIFCGSSVRIQSLIRFAQSQGKGGIEYLFSVPASIGGAVFMNAGRGKSAGKSISDYIVRVRYLDMDSMIFTDLYGNTGYGFRYSPFQEMEAIIVGVEFSFDSKSKEDVEKGIQERLAFSKQNLSADKPSCGSVFSIVNPILIRLFKGQRIGGAMFVKKNYNWIVNLGNASSSDIRCLVNRVIRLHRFFHLPIKTEIRFLG